MLSISNKPKKIKIILPLGTVLGILGVACAVYVLIPRDTQIKSATIDALPAASLPSKLELPKDKLEQTFTSPALEAEFEFNAIAPVWQQSDSQNHQVVEIRTSDQSGEWSDWMHVEPGTAGRDGKTQDDKVFPETPLFVEGNEFQYRVTLNRDSIDQETPVISDIKINYMDSRPTASQKISAAVKDFFTPTKAIAGNTPPIISRAGWGSPDPNGDMFKGDDQKYWTPVYAPTKQVFLHHTVSSNSASDSAAVIRGIWNYHANTLNWGDIGYNYLVDQQGRIYEGRFGGDHIVAGHTLNYNTGSLGVAVLGCFEQNSTCNQLNGGGTSGPSNASIENLAVLLSWKTSIFGIDPKGEQTFCKFDDSGCLHLLNIAAHRNAYPTECNGQLFYDRIGEVRQKTDEKNRQKLWGTNYANFVKKSSFNTTQQLFYGTDTAIYVSFWGPGYTGVWNKKVMTAPFREKFVDVYKINEPDGTTQTLYAATQLAVYKISFENGDFEEPVKLLTNNGIKKIAADIKEESETTHRLYVLAQDGPYEYWWRDDNVVSNGFRLWNINNGIDLIKSADPDDLDEVYVATSGEVYRMKWPINSDIQRKQITNLRDTVAIEKQTLADETELLYTATRTGVHETWWKQAGNFSNPVKIIQANHVVGIKKTLTNNYQQLYVAQPGSVHEFWWGPGSGGIKGGRILNIPQNTIMDIDKSANGTYQNLYTASQSFIFETWWGNGKFGSGAIVNIQ